jgi:HEAT repeat protein
VEGKSDETATVQVRMIADSINRMWPGALISRTRILIDDRVAGFVRGEQPQSFTFPAGVLRVTARGCLLRSQTLVLSLRDGESAALQCGLRSGTLIQLGFLATMFAGSCVLVPTAIANLSKGYNTLAGTATVMFAVMLIELVRATLLPGARLFLRPDVVLDTSDASPTQCTSARYLSGIEPRAGRFQIGLRGLLILVICCGALFWIARELWDRRPENAPTPAIRLLRSEDASERLIGARDLQILLIMNSLTPNQVGAVVSDLLGSLRDQQSEVKKAVAQSFVTIGMNVGRSSGTVPGSQEIASRLAEALRDPETEVRRHSALALASMYLTYPQSGGTAVPSPQALDRFLDRVSDAIEDPNLEVRAWAFQVLGAIAPRAGRPAPQRLLAALGSKESRTRTEVVQTLVKFPQGVDACLPQLFEVVERDEDPMVRQYAFMSMTTIRPSAAAIPDLLKALRSPERKARFRAADLLSYIGPKASAAIPAVLPLLDEQFEPATKFEREHPEWNDPAVAAAWALHSIAPGTERADLARSSLLKLKSVPGHPWRRDEVEAALRALHTNSDAQSTPE